MSSFKTLFDENIWIDTTGGRRNPETVERGYDPDDHLSGNTPPQGFSLRPSMIDYSLTEAEQRFFDNAQAASANFSKNRSAFFHAGPQVWGRYKSLSANVGVFTLRNGTEAVTIRMSNCGWIDGEKKHRTILLDMFGTQKGITDILYRYATSLRKVENKARSRIFTPDNRMLVAGAVHSPERLAFREKSGYVLVARPK